MGIENLSGSPIYNFINLAEAFTCPLFITSMKPEEKSSVLFEVTDSDFLVEDESEFWDLQWIFNKNKFTASNNMAASLLFIMELSKDC